MFCFDTLYVDQDLTAPGVNIAIFAKNWKIIGKRQISLKGNDGSNYTLSASN